jgi:nucleotide-binding universal stress UspA family protein
MATVLVAIDGSDPARRAAEAARELLGASHRWELVAAVSPHGDRDDGVLGRFDRPRLSDEVIAGHVREAEAVTLEVGRELELDGEVRVETGEPGPVICETAARLGADLIVVGSQGHGVIERGLLGSVSRHVIEQAPCPVFVDRAPT